MYGALLACVCILFAKGGYGSKVLTLATILYITTLLMIQHSWWLSFQDYIDVYTTLTTILIILLFQLTEKKVFIKAVVVLTTLPHAYYLYMLHNPYILFTSIPLWWLQQVDIIFCWGVVAIVHEQKLGWDVSEMNVREYLVNFGIVVGVLILIKLKRREL